jgi:hypothetical protein
MPSTIENNNHKLSPYELKRLERIKKNEEHLKKLGLYQFGLMRKKPKKKRNALTLSSSQIKPGDERRSRRLVSDNGKVVAIQDNYDDDANDKVVVSSYYKKTSTKKIRIKTNNVNEWKLSEQELASLSKVDNNYLDKFQEFLVFQNKISEQNVRNVMRQARKLASGDGIRYEVCTMCYFISNHHLSLFV